jgi:hypothetical protein
MTAVKKQGGGGFWKEKIFEQFSLLKSVKTAFPQNHNAGSINKYSPDGLILAGLSSLVF